MTDVLKRTWAEVDLDALVHNFRVAETLAGCPAMPVVKADAYGHGADFVAPALEAAGARSFGVSNIEEALRLRDIGIRGEILILGHTPAEFVPLLADRHIDQAVFSAEYAGELRAQARRANRAIRVHVKLNTGMNRLGFSAYEDDFDESLRAILQMFDGPELIPAGIFSHLAASDRDGDETGEYTARQSFRFRRMREALAERGLRFPAGHLCQSGGIMTRSRDAADRVRPGIMLYGYPPAPGILPEGFTLKPVLTLKTATVFLQRVRKGETVGYGRGYTAPRDMTVATVPVGYADGYPRAVSGKGARMLLRGRFVPVVGRVCMDQTMLDVTDLPEAQVGDEVIVYGTDGRQILPATEPAALAGTISYEILCHVGKRVPRVYYREGRRIAATGYFAGCGE